jgi:1-acyl-sn-glycerol-3-phosphate acyltransferase
VSLPDLSRTPRPSTTALRLGRPPARWLLERRWDVRVHGADRVPRFGPQVVAGNHIGFIDGPLLAAVHPRPVHMLTKREMFQGPTGAALRLFAQVPLDREEVDPGAVKTCLRILGDGGAVGIFPEGTRGAGELAQTHPGVAYLPMVAGAPVVPVAVFGSREPGGGLDSLPPRGSRIDIVYGEPVAVEPSPWPRTREQTRATLAFLTEALRAHLTAARDLTGRELPGPIPGVLA